MWQDALKAAWPQWQDALARTGWHQAAFATAYGLAAWLCHVCGHAARQDAEDPRLWFAAAWLLVVLGLNTWLQFDVLLVHLVRSLARAQGWYGQRREVQCLAMTLLAAGGLAALGWLRARLSAHWRTCAPAVAGSALLVAVAVVRLVSHHGTDALMNQRLAGASAGRLVEFAGLCLAAAGARRWLRAR